MLRGELDHKQRANLRHYLNQAMLHWLVNEWPDVAEKIGAPQHLYFDERAWHTAWLMAESARAVLEGQLLVCQQED